MTSNGQIPMKDKEMMHDSLSAQKEMTGIYNISANECATPAIRNAMLGILNEEHAIQAEVFDAIHQRGWYPTTPAPEQKVQSARQKYQSNS